MKRILSALVCLLAVPAVGATVDAPQVARVQHEIARFKGLKSDAVARRDNPFPKLALDYLRAFEPYLLAGGPFSLEDDRGWGGSNGRGEALRRRIERDMREWHPIFALTFLETVLAQPDSGVYVLMLNLEGRNVADAVARRERLRVEELRQPGRPDSVALRMARAEILDERLRLWETLSATVDGSIVRTLVQSLQADSFSPRLNVVTRVTRVLERISDDGRYLRFAERVREGGGSSTLPETVHDTVVRLLSDPELDWSAKPWHFASLLNLFVILQNEASRDYLLLLFGDFDRFDDQLGEWVADFDVILNLSTARFIDVSFRQDPEKELGLDVIDQLTRWIVARLALVDTELRHERILDTLLLLRLGQPAALESYIVRFYRDFHALNPAGYETVVFQLVSILLRYAEAGVFTDGGLPAHEKVMDVLRWYNAALAETVETLPRLDIQFVEREQRAVLDTIFEHIERSTSGTRLRQRLADARFIETLLLLVERIAEVADPEDVEVRILQPLAEILSLDRNPVVLYDDRDVRNAVRECLQQVRRYIAR